jgi:hypothetical protein
MGLLTLSVPAWIFVFAAVKIADYVYGGVISALFLRYKVALHPGLLTISTTRFNSRIESTAKRYRRFFRVWFSVGVALGFAGLILSVVLLSGNLASAILYGINSSPLSATDGKGPLFMEQDAMPQGIRQSPPDEASPWALFQRLFAPRDHGSVRHLFAWHRHGYVHQVQLNYTQVTDTRSELQNREPVVEGSGARRVQAQGPGSGVYADPSPLGAQGQHQGPHSLPDESLRRPSRRTDSGNRIWRHGRSIEAFDHKIVTAELGANVLNEQPAGPMRKFTSGTSAHKPGSPASTAQGVSAFVSFGRQILADKMEVGLHEHVEPPETGQNDTENSSAQAFRDKTPNSTISGDMKSNNDASQNPENMNPFHGAGKTRVRHSRPQLLRPLVPGVTIPMNDVGYIAVAILLSAVFHELGHALAAAIDEAKVDSVGGFLALVFPGAYVQLSGMSVLPPFRQLRVYCAGAWHNVVLASGCIVLAITLPFSLIPVYSRGHGAVVVSLPGNSALRGHVKIGDVVVGLGHHPVLDGGRSFRSAVEWLARSGESTGFCVSERMYQKFARPQSECCMMVDRGEEHPKLYCFAATEDSARGPKRICMRPSVVYSKRTCRSSSDCRGYVPNAKARGEVMDSRMRGSQRRLMGVQKRREEWLSELNSTKAGEYESPGRRATVDASPERCFAVELPMQQKLIDVRIQSLENGLVNHVFFQGHAHILGQSLSVSSYVFRWRNTFPRALVRAFAFWDFPNIIERQLQYAASISLALALLNMAPVFWLDGEASAILFVKLFMPSVDSFKLSKIKGTLLYIGTMLLALNILLAVIE